MTNKIWYVCTDARIDDHDYIGVVQYFGRKTEAEKTLKKVIKMDSQKQPKFKASYIDWNWRTDIKQGRTTQELHGKRFKKVDSIIDYLTAQS